MGGYPHIFELIDIKDINYFLHLVLVIKKERDLTTKFLSEANATLLNFNGIIPSKKNVMDMHQPDITELNKWQVTNGIRVKQQYEPYIRKRTL